VRKAPALRAASFDELRNWAADDALAALQVFKAAAAFMLEGGAVLRPARVPSAMLLAVCRAALSARAHDAVEARAFFEAHFEPFEIFSDTPLPPREKPFFTGYFEPGTKGALTPGPRFQAPILARPLDLVTLPRAERLPGSDEVLTSARRVARRLLPFPDRAAIEAGALAGQGLELVWLKDRVEVFIIQVQGSARVKLTDGRLIRLRYAGRNGWPYTSVGRLLIEKGAIAEHEMSLEVLTGWLRAHPREAEAILRRNRSYVFFAIETAHGPEEGPIGGAGVPLTAGRSIAVDRGLWCYGLPFWVDVDRPLSGGGWGRWQRLMIAQDTGAAIVGAGRVDLFVGSGAAAGTLAGRQRHHGRLFVLLPRGAGAPRS
jgi:membrane-bound lytic murein transglycosylase A